MSLHPISDKAEVSSIFPTRPTSAVLAGTRSSTPTPMTTASPSGWCARGRIGARRMHLHYGLLADILVELARSLASRPELDEQHRTELKEAANQLCRSLEPRPES